MGEAKRRHDQSAALAAAEDGHVPLTPRSLNRLHEAHSKWIGAQEHLQLAQAAWIKLLVEACDVLGIEIPKTGTNAQQLDLSRVEVDFLAGWVAIRGAAPAPTAKPPSSPVAAATGSEQEEAATP